MRELDIHKMLSHKHLIRLYEIIDDESDDKVYLVIEFAEKGQILDLDESTQKFRHHFTGSLFLPERQIQTYAKQLVAAVAYLHNKKVIHCDLKPQNILLDADSNIKIADFGSAQMFYEEEDTLLNHKGTYEFLAPECHK